MDGSTAPPETPAVVEPLITQEGAEGPRFCTRCGAPWVAEAESCEACAIPVMPAGESAEEGSRHSVRNAMGMYFSLLAVALGGIIAGQMGVEELTVELVLFPLWAVIVLIWTAVWWRELWPLLRARVSPKWFLAAAALGLATFGIATGVIETMHRVLGMEKLLYSPAFLEGGYGWSVIILFICVEPAITEELAFRGVIISSLRPALTMTEAVFVSALTFMTLHLSPAAFPHTFALGLAAGFLRVKTSSLLPCFLIHFTHNLMCIVVEWAYETGAAP